MTKILTLTRGEEVKLIDPSSKKLIDRCKELGFVVQDGVQNASDDGDVEALRVRADELGLQYHPKTGAKKLKDLIEEAEKNASDDGEKGDSVDDAA